MRALTVIVAFVIGLVMIGQTIARIDHPAIGGGGTIIAIIVLIYGLNKFYQAGKEPK